MTPLFWVMTPFVKGHGDSRYPIGQVHGLPVGTLKASGRKAPSAVL